jgi:hypothetical protein
MTTIRELLETAETEILNTRRISGPTCEAFRRLPLETRTAYANAFRFLGCDSIPATAPGGITVSEPDRIRAASFMLLSLYIDTSVPAWSSWTLDRLLEAVLGPPGGSIGDLFHALYSILAEYSCALTEETATLIKTIVIKSFTEHRLSYEATDLHWMVHKTIVQSNAAQAYLALHALPPDIMEPECCISVLRRLVSTPYWAEALDTLHEDLRNPETKALLREWLAEGIASPFASDVAGVLS